MDSDPELLNDAEVNEDAASVDTFFIVGIGASAGGLEPIKSFFKNIPAQCRHSFILVQHLSPDYESLMGSLLGKHTRLPIVEVQREVEVQPGHIYTLPNKKNLILKDGKLVPVDRAEKNRLNLPIDELFRSLAADRGPGCAGIILSGSGSDGTRGVRAIKEAGGYVMVQDPGEAEFDSMPLSAISTGVVDAVASVAEMSLDLITYLSYPLAQRKILDEVNQNQDILSRILKQVDSISGQNFRLYKKPTLARRIERRMTVNNFSDVKDYLYFLLENKDEANILKQEFLIGVTSFFRDPDAWTSLRTNVTNPLVKEKAENSRQIRAWSVACSTGEEPYSLAIQLCELMDHYEMTFDIKIYATDINQESLEVARKGVYPNSVAADVEPALLEKYFTRKDDVYYVMDRVRRMVIFSFHNILNDPPFKDMDLILCRNMLIYFNAEAQQIAVNKLHYALHAGAALMLGPSESINLDKPAGLELVDKRSKIYRNTFPLARMNAGSRDPGTLRKIPQITFQHMSKKPQYPIQEAMIEAIINDLGALSVLINENYDIIHARGDIRRLTEQPATEFSANLLKLMPENVALVIRRAVRSAISQKSRVSQEGVEFPLGDDRLLVNLSVVPYDSQDQNLHPDFLITFIPQPAVPPPVQGPRAMLREYELDPVVATDARIAELEQELSKLQRDLLESAEAADVINEELQSSNEELISANEELQSTNEELHSMNEELHTVNAELNERNDELLLLNDDMQNLLESTEVSTLFLDRDLCIRKFTPGIKEHFHLLKNDLGRPLKHLAHNFEHNETGASILKDVQHTLETANTITREVQLKNKVWYLVKMSPFRRDNVVDGVVLNFVDINELKMAEQKYRDQNIAFEQVLESSLAGYWDWMIQENSEYMSPTFKAMFGYKDDEMENSPDAWQKIIYPDDLPVVLESYRNHVESRGTIPYDNKVRYYHKDGSIVWVYCRGRVIEWDEKDQPVRMVGSHVNITELVRAEEESKRNEQRFKLAVDGTKSGVWHWLDINGNEEWWSPRFYELLGYDDNEVPATLEHFAEALHPDDKERTFALVQEHFEGTADFDIEYRLQTKSGEYRWFLGSGIAERDETGAPVSMIGSIIDIHERRIAEEQLAESRELLQMIMNKIPDMVFVKDSQLCLLDVNQAFIEGYPEDMREDLIGSTGLNLFHEQQRAEIMEKERYALKNGPVEGYESWIMHDGFPIRMHIRRIPFKTADGESLLLGIMRDVTEREQLLDSLTKSNEELQEFAHVASHDLRAPLRSISHLAAWIEEDNEDILSEKTLEHFKSLNARIDRMYNLLDSMITFSRMGGANLDFEPVALRGVLEEVVDAVNPPEAFTLEVACPDLTLHTSRFMMNVILQNLIENAIKHHHREKGHIQVRCIERPGQVQIEIEDDGPGIPDEYQETVFKLFRKLESRDQVEGSGMGLAIVKKFVRYCHGKLDLVSEPGKGSVFSLTFYSKPPRRIVQ